MQADLTQLGSFIASAPDAMLVARGDGTILLANQIAHELFRAEAGELIGLCVDELVPRTLREGHAEHRRDYSVAPSTRPMGAGIELRAERRDGSEFPTEISLSPLPSGDEQLVLAAVRDLTLRKLAEQRLIEARLELDHRLASERQALEINDNIVQSLAVADYRMQMGEHGEAHEAVRASLDAARQITTDLLGRPGGKLEIEPGDLRRGRSAGSDDGEDHH